jgi:hypothetical protein
MEEIMDDLCKILIEQITKAIEERDLDAAEIYSRILQRVQSQSIVATR